MIWTASLFNFMHSNSHVRGGYAEKLHTYSHNDSDTVTCFAGAHVRHLTLTIVSCLFLAFQCNGVLASSFTCRHGASRPMKLGGDGSRRRAKEEFLELKGDWGRGKGANR